MVFLIIAVILTISFGLVVGTISGVMYLIAHNHPIWAVLFAIAVVSLITTTVIGLIW